MTTNTHTSELRRVLARIAQQLTHLVPPDGAVLTPEQRVALARDGVEILAQATQALHDQIALDLSRRDALEATP